MATDDAEKRHGGVVKVVLIGEKGLAVIKAAPHYRHECELYEQAVEKAASDVVEKFGVPKTVFEASSVGYSRLYAANYDAVFRNN